MNNSKIQWHPGFCGGLELELRSYADILEYHREKELFKKPVRIDLLVIKKSADINIQKSFAKVFKKHNIVEYKSPGDELSIDDLYKTIGYAGLYKGLGKYADEIKADEISISMFRYEKPVKLFSTVKSLGGNVEKKYDGVYYVSGIINIPTQVVVMGELDNEDGVFLKTLTDNLSYEDAKNFLEATENLREPADRHNIDALVQVSGSANRELYDMIRREDPMCEFLRELFKDELIQERGEGLKQGREQGREQGIKAFILDKLEDGFSEKDIVKRLVKRFDLTEDMAEEFVLKYSGVTV